MTLKESKEFANWLAFKLVMFYVLGSIIMYLINKTDYGRDDSDLENGARSGLQIRTDHLTNCQYFETREGGITPRLDKDGNHVGCEY